MFDAGKSADKVVSIDAANTGHAAHEPQQLCIEGMHQPSADEAEAGAGFAEAAGLGRNHPMARRRARLRCLMMLLQPSWFTNGRWSDVQGGFRDSRADKIFSFDDCEGLIAARIDELGLDVKRVNAFPSSIWNSIDAEQAFYRLSFSEQMNRFKK